MQFHQLWQPSPLIGTGAWMLNSAMVQMMAHRGMQTIRK
uniref:Uncharacterized protein n=1 Tax=Arundo donax TaxID=35708 RepID=A0A0A8ZNN9_ARUDO